MKSTGGRLAALRFLLACDTRRAQVCEQAVREEESTWSTRQLESQVVDLTRLRLVFGLPLACQRNAGEDRSNEAVPGNPRSDAWGDIAGAVRYGWLRTPRWLAERRRYCSNGAA